MDLVRLMCLPPDPGAHELGCCRPPVRGLLGVATRPVRALAGGAPRTSSARRRCHRHLPTFPRSHLPTRPHFHAQLERRGTTP